jgi:hypothetical protein
MAQYLARNVPVRIISAFWIYSDDDDPAIELHLLENDGRELWDVIVLIPSMKYRWEPFLDAIGITLKDVKNETYVNPGYRIQRIGSWKPNSDEYIINIKANSVIKW